MSNIKKILSLTVCFVLLTNTLAYADTVIIGAAPTSNDKAIVQNASNNSTFLQNQYTGPGTMPSSSNNLGTSPLMAGISYDNSVGQQAAMIDANGVSNNKPVASSDKKSTAAAGLSGPQSTGVIYNNAVTTGGTSSTSDNGPVSKESSGPSGSSSNNSGTSAVIGADGSYISGSGPAAGNPTAPSASKTVVSNVPTNSGQTNISTGTIKYEAIEVEGKKPTISAPAGLVVNASTRQIYFSKGGFGSYAPAALTNLVTAYVLLSYKTLDDVLVVSDQAVKNLEAGASTANLKAGDTITVRDALGALFVKSCCDVANVIAENVAGSNEAFVAIMNQVVMNLGCVGTVFANPTGLNNDIQKTNTYDVAVIMDAVTMNENIKIMLGLTRYKLPATNSRGALNLISKNSLLDKTSSQYYKGVVASRLGYTSKAKYTMASMIDYNGNKLIAVVLKANGSQFSDTKKLLDFGKVACVAAGVKKITNSSSNVMTGQIQTLLNTVQNTSVSAKDTNGSWQKDAHGWYFIKTDGIRANNEWIKVNGKMYCVDSTGYMVTGWREFSNGKMYYFDPTNGEFRYNTWVNTDKGAFYLQADGTLAKADAGKTTNITTSVGTYTIDDTGKAIAKVN